MYGRYEHARIGELQAKSAYAAVEARYQNVSEDLEHIETPQGKEGALRQRYNLARPGEGAIRIVASKPPPEEATKPAAQENMWAAIWHGITPW
jgi:hypothetical protein